MEIDGFLMVAGSGSLGGVLVEGLKLAKRLQQGRRPKQWTNYILGSVILIIVAGIFAGIHTGHVNTLLVAVQLGVAAPALIGAWVTGHQTKLHGFGIAPQFESGWSKFNDAVGW